MQSRIDSRRVRLFAALLTLTYRPLVRRAARRALEGRLLDPERPERGRWLRCDVNRYLCDVWARVADLIPKANLDGIPTYGNRHNVFLAVVTTAAYQVLVERGVERKYVATLTADVGWKIYAWLLNAVAAPVRITTRDPHERMERILRILMVWPFNAPGAPGYEVRAWSEGDRFFTHWTHCPPQAFVRQLVEGGDDAGELDAFRRSWCLYDWPGADLLAGDGTTDHYARPHTMSRGDSVCDMCWWGGAAKAADDPKSAEEGA
jgi:hypothetical protein